MEEGIRVPGIVAWPGHIPGGRVDATPVHGCVWLPTLYSLAGKAAPAGAKPSEGVNLMPLRKEKVRHSRQAFSQTPPTSRAIGQPAASRLSDPFRDTSLIRVLLESII